MSAKLINEFLTLLHQCGREPQVVAGAVLLASEDIKEAERVLQAFTDEQILLNAAVRREELEAQGVEHIFSVHEVRYLPMDTEAGAELLKLLKRLSAGGDVDLEVDIEKPAAPEPNKVHPVPQEDRPADLDQLDKKRTAAFFRSQVIDPLLQTIMAIGEMPPGLDQRTAAEAFVSIERTLVNRIRLRADQARDTDPVLAADLTRAAQRMDELLVEFIRKQGLSHDT